MIKRISEWFSKLENFWLVLAGTYAAIMLYALFVENNEPAGMSALILASIFLVGGGIVNFTRKYVAGAVGYLLDELKGEKEKANGE